MNMLESYLSSPKSLLSFLSKDDDNWCIKDKEAKYVYLNRRAREDFNYPKNFDPKGKSDKEIPTKICQELWPEFMKIDNEVVEKNKKITSIAIHYYGKGNIDNPVPYLSEQSPLYDDSNEIIGIVCHGKRLKLPSLLYYMNRLNRKTIQFDAPNDTFTKRELEIIFWAQQRLTVKEIAKRLDISSRTAEVHLKNIYRKADVHNAIHLIEYCKHTGLDRYIPADFIRKGVQLID